jgi:hypothetical protein
MSTALARRAEPALLMHYDTMCRAIEQAYEVDEVKDIRDKHIALQTYFRLAENVEAERQACEIRLRAERKAGAILRSIEKAKGARAPGTNRGTTRSVSDTASTLADLGISRQQSSEWQKLAAVPEPAFEAAVKAPGASTSGIIAAHTKEKPQDTVDENALWLWGRLLEFDRRGLLARDPAEVIATGMDHMKETTRLLAPRVAAWLGRIT